jgi:hypothetical protein
MKLLSIKTLAVSCLLIAISLTWNACVPAADPVPTGTPPPGLTNGFQINSDVTWPDINEDMTVPDYIVRGNIVIEDDVMLTVMPGVVVQFESAGDGITVANGALRAVGRGDKPIIFKGLRENKGSWLGLQFFSNDARNELAYCKVMHAGSTNGSQTAINVKGNLGIYPAQLKISNTEVSQSGGYGIIIDKVSHFGSFRTNSFHECDRAGARITNPQIGSLDASSNFFGNVLNYVGSLLGRKR